MLKSNPRILGLVIALGLLIALSGIVFGSHPSASINITENSAKHNATGTNQSLGALRAETDLTRTAKSSENCTDGAGVHYKSVTIDVTEISANNSASNTTLNENPLKSEKGSKDLSKASEQNETTACYSISKTSSLEANASACSSSTSNHTALASGNCINCSQVLNASIPVNEPPSCRINAPSRVCADSTGNVASVPYQDGATYEWGITGGEITSDANESQITWTAGPYPTSVNLRVNVTRTNSSGSNTSVCVCSSNISVPVCPNLGCALYIPNLSVCEGSTNRASVPLQINATYHWDVINGSITSGQGTNQIFWMAERLANASPSTATIKVTVGRIPGNIFNVCTCSKSVELNVNPNPDCNITAPSSVCKGSKNNKASVPDAGLGATYRWEISNGVITAGQGTREITWDAGLGPLPVVINVKVTNAYGCSCRSEA